MISALHSLGYGGPDWSFSGSEAVGVGSVNASYPSSKKSIPLKAERVTGHLPLDLAGPLQRLSLKAYGPRKLMNSLFFYPPVWVGSGEGEDSYFWANGLT
jgi:hypothetical protein